ncbi:potassium channel subfamily K, other eukaryote [Entomortierella parvispora]|uniref:Potassium channel subfamily K, other eukaryote n=1 Tax=Entomortierella parvispora TaxID=205924 RepID=A0A9P3LX56_9FUNG|nr:potassium channel subfamily K, other eukaryote [Entomortierella parvispora]
MFTRMPKTLYNADDASSLSSRSEHRPSAGDFDPRLEILRESDGPLGTPRVLKQGFPGGGETDAIRDIERGNNVDPPKQPPPVRSRRILGLLRSLTAKTRPKDTTLGHHHAGFKTHVPADINELESHYRVLPLAIGFLWSLIECRVSILINVPSLTSPWVGLSEFNPATKVWSDPQEISVPNWMSAMVIGALVMAILCNICVLSRFLERHVWHSVVLSLIAASLQDFLCVGVIVPFCLKYPQSKGYVYMEGFWTMVASMVFSMSATVMLSIDIYRTPHFRLHGSGVTHKQRILIAEAMSLCFYLAIGALIFIWIEKWTFLKSLFFVMVTITTIGFGNTVPETSAGRVFVVFYGAGGIVLFAMAVNAIRYVILEDLHHQFALRAKERKLKREARRRERREERLREKEKRRRVKETLRQLALTNGASMLDPSQNNRSHYFSILPKHFTIHGSSKRLSGHFGNENGNPSEDNQKKSGTTEAPSGDFLSSLFATGPSPDQDEAKDHHIIGMTRSASSPTHGSAAFGKAIDDIFNENRNSDQEVQNTTSATQTRNKEKTGSLSSIPRHRSFLGLVLWAIKYIYRATGRALGWRRAESFSRIAEVQPTAKEQREADKQLAHEESIEEYNRRLRFSFLLFMSFWLIGAAVFQSLEGWSFGMAMYFSFVAFSTIGYGDLVPSTLAGQSLFLAYCLVGIVTLTFLASLVSELLSKKMRRHVVQTQLRRSERFLEHGDRLVQSPSEQDPEQGETDDGMGSRNESSSDDVLHAERMQRLQSLVSQSVATGTDGVDGAQPKSCQGSLRNLIQVSRDFDMLLRKVLGVDYDGGGNVLQGKDVVTTPKVAVESNSESILEYLEKEDDTDSSYLSPSISRDVTSTSSIHRHSIAKARSYMNVESTGTYHGTGSSSQSSSQFSITAWPASAAAAAAGISAPTGSSAQGRNSSHRQSPANTPLSFSTIHRSNPDGTVTIAAVHWQHLIEYSKQFRILTDSCDQTLKRLLAWEAREKKESRKRQRAKERQQRLLRERRLRLFRLGGTYGAVDDGIEDEEELDEWEEEGSHYEDDDETTVNNDGRGIYSADEDGTGGGIDSLDDKILDKTRESIANDLLGADRALLTRQSQSQIHSSLATPQNPAFRTAHHQRTLAVPPRALGVERLVGTRATPGRGRPLHSPVFSDQSADESSATAGSVAGRGGAASPSHSRTGSMRATARDREGGAAARRRSRSRSRQRGHSSHGDGTSASHSARTGLQRPPLSTIHTNVALFSEEDS